MKNKSQLLIGFLLVLTGSLVFQNNIKEYEISRIEKVHRIYSKSYESNLEETIKIINIMRDRVDPPLNESALIPVIEDDLYSTWFIVSNNTMYPKIVKEIEYYDPEQPYLWTKYLVFFPNEYHIEKIWLKEWSELKVKIEIGD
jgi:hypothetical protein